GLPDYQSAQLGNTNSLFKIKLANDRNAANPNGPSMVGHSGRIDIESTDIKSLPQQQVLECAGTGAEAKAPHDRALEAGIWRSGPSGHNCDLSRQRRTQGLPKSGRESCFKVRCLAMRSTL